MYLPQNITITRDLMDLLNELKTSRPKFTVTHGGLGGAEARQENDKRKDPMVLVKQYIDRANLRLVDFFNSIDKDKSMSVTKEELEIGLEVSRCWCGSCCYAGHHMYSCAHLHACLVLSMLNCMRNATAHAFFYGARK